MINHVMVRLFNVENDNSFTNIIITLYGLMIGPKTLFPLFKQPL